MKKYRVKSIQGIQGGVYYRPQVKFKYIPLWIRCHMVDYCTLSDANKYIELIKKEL